jgi:hypothetical protein
MTTDGEGAEQAVAAMLARITAAPTHADKVKALLDALDWGRSSQVDTKGVLPGRIARDRIIFALNTVALFFKVVGRYNLGEDFLAHASALSDLDRGVVHETLEKVSRKGGPLPQCSNVWRGRAYVAAAMDVLHRGGRPMKEIKCIVDSHQELRPLLDKKKRAPERTLGDIAEGWRDQFNRGTVDNHDAATVYDHFRTTAAVRCVGPDKPKIHAELLLHLAYEAISANWGSWPGY